MKTIGRLNYRLLTIGAVLLLGAVLSPRVSFARDIEYGSGEVSINVVPGEPTQIQFPGEIKGGYKPKISAIDLDRKDGDLIIFASEGLTDKGEAIIVRLGDGRSYSLRIRLADEQHPRDDVIKIEDRRSGSGEEEEETAGQYKDKKFDYAPSTTVTGLLREMVLVAELGKKGIAGYKVSDRYKGETVLSDGTMRATIDRIFIGPNLWGYVLDARNMLDQAQQINPASLRIDGTRAISANRWELAARPLNIEQQISDKDSAKIYIVTRAKRYR